jgi:hypothetical protein
MYSASPSNRLRQIQPGETVTLANVPGALTVSTFRDDGYVELTRNNRLIVTASAGHEIEGGRDDRRT